MVSPVTMPAPSTSHTMVSAMFSGVQVLFSGGRLVYRDWADRKPAGHFLDHCHLDPTGNEDLARWMEEELAHAP